MDESEAKVSIDLSGRAYFIFQGEFPKKQVGELSTEMVVHFFRSIADSLHATIHMEIVGENTHHMVEALFKSFARALQSAIQKTSSTQLPSTKGIL